MLALFALTAFAVAQPLFDLLARTPEFLLVRRADALDVVILVAAVALVPPLLLAAVELAAGVLGRVPRLAVHVGMVALLGAVGALPAINRHLGGPAFAAFELAAIAGLVLAAACVWSPAFRGLLVWLAPASLVFPALFLLRPSTALILAPPSIELEAAPGGADVPIVMVVFDEFPAFALVGDDGAIDATLFPNFARLAREGTWFRNATSNATVTPRAVGAIVTGRLLGPDAFGDPTTRTNNLFSLLGAAYDFEVTESYVPFCPPGLCGPVREGSRPARQRDMLADAGIVLLHAWTPASLQARLPALAYSGLLLGAGKATAAPAERRTHRHWSRTPAERAAVIERFIASIGPRTRPALHYLHVLVPHVPYVYEPSGGVCSGWERLPEAAWWYRDHEPFVMQQRLLLQVGWVDRAVGRLIDRLERQGLYDRTLLVLVADHGISFRPAEHRRALTAGNACDVLGVPLFIKRPHERAGGVSDRNVELIDVLPTIAHVVGIEIPWRVDGRSAFAPGAEREAKTVAGPSWPTEKRLEWREEALRFPARFGVECLLSDRPNAPVAWGTGPERLFRVGAHGHLIGHVIRGDEVAPPADVMVAWRDVDPAAPIVTGSGEVPCLVEGDLIVEDGGAEGVDLAIAINGIIEAVGQTSARHEEPAAAGAASAAFSIPVPARAFHAGRNDVRVFLPRRDAGRVRLVPVRGQSGEGPSRAQSASASAAIVQLPAPGDELGGPLPSRPAE